MEMSETGFNARGDIPARGAHKEQCWADHLSALGLTTSLHCCRSAPVGGEVNAGSLLKLDSVLAHWNRCESNSP